MSGFIQQCLFCAYCVPCTMQAATFYHSQSGKYISLDPAQPVPPGVVHPNSPGCEALGAGADLERE